MVCGLVQPVRGEVRCGGRPIRSLGEDYLRRITHLGHSNAIKDDLTCRENLAVSSALTGRRIEGGALGMALKEMELSRYVDVAAKVLSQGQKRRLALARLLLVETPIWILDEPFNALDGTAIGAIRSAIEEHLRRGGIVVLTSHQDVGLEAPVTKHLEMGR